MKNPFRRQPSDIDRQLEALRAASVALNEAADRVNFETSAPVLRQKLAELDPRLLDLLMDQSRYEAIVGVSKLSGQRRTAVESCRYAYDYDVQIGNATNTWTDWGFGRKLDITAVDAQANEVWQECWLAARNRPVFRQSVVSELSNAVLTDGEVFFVGSASTLDGATTWRTFDTTAITEIIHPVNDNKVNLWYTVQLEARLVAIPDAFSYYSLSDLYKNAELPAGVADYNAELNERQTFAVIVPAMRNRDKEGRGWPEFRKALPWSSVYSQMLREYSAVFSAVAMYVDKLKVQGGSRTVTDIITALQSSLATSAGAYTDTNPRPAAGSAWVENEALDRTRLPLGSAAGDAQQGTLIMATQLATALGVTLPDVGRIDAAQNKSVAEIGAQGPQQRWQRYQVFWSDVWQDIVETTLRNAEKFGKRKFSSYESRLSTSLPMDIDTETIAKAMDANDKSAAAMTVDMGVATRANTALLKLMLVDLGVDDVDAIIEPPAPETPAATEAHFGESHTPVTVAHGCPLCGASSAYSYEGHGGLLVCVECGKTYDPEVE